MVVISDNAVTRIDELMREEDNSNLKLRMFIQGGGCAGFSYGFTFDDEQNEDDFVIPAGPRSVLVDSMSMQYLENAIVDYKEDLSGSRFSISNPMAVSTCGCGSSFSI